MLWVNLLNIQTNKYKCFIIHDTMQTQTICDKSFQNLKNNAINFTTISQKLLFQGETDLFSKYKNLD